MLNKEDVRNKLLKAIKDRESLQNVKDNSNEYKEELFRREDLELKIDINKYGYQGNCLKDIPCTFIYEGNINEVVKLGNRERFSRYLMDSDFEDWVYIVLTAGLYMTEEEAKQHFERLYRGINDPSKCILFIETPKYFNKRVGTISLVFKENIAYIEDFAIIPEVSNLGLSEVLIRGCLYYFKKQNIKQVKINISSRNYIAVKSLLACDFCIDKKSSEKDRFVNIIKRIYSNGTMNGISDSANYVVMRKLKKMYSHRIYTYRYNVKNKILEVRFFERKLKMKKDSFIYGRFKVKIVFKNKKYYATFEKIEENLWEYPDRSGVYYLSFANSN